MSASIDSHDTWGDSSIYQTLLNSITPLTKVIGFAIDEYYTRCNGMSVETNHGDNIIWRCHVFLKVANVLKKSVHLQSHASIYITQWGKL